jgi:hypothetical protein
MEYDYTMTSFTYIFGSCVLAFCVNLSIFLVIGKTDPIAYNVLGHFKLCVILLTGYAILTHPSRYLLYLCWWITQNRFVVFGEDMNGVKIFGTLLAFIGVVTYSTLQQGLDNGTPFIHSFVCRLAISSFRHHHDNHVWIIAWNKQPAATPAATTAAAPATAPVAVEVVARK